VEEIFIPASGMAAEDVLVAEWLKQPGDQVSTGDILAVVENDKATMELSSTTAGRLSRHLVNAGDRVPGGTTVAYVLGEGESEPGGPSAAPPAPADASTSSPGAGLQPPHGATGATTERQADGRHTMSPRQRRELAAASASAGSGLGASDVTSSSENASGNGSPAQGSSNRQATAALVSESWKTVPHFSVGRDVRADGLLEAVSAAKKAGKAVTVTDYLALALASALDKLGEPSDVGLAVATDWGVLIPVLRSLVGRSISEVATLREAAVTRARSRKLDPGDTRPVFATLSNLGPGGVTWFTGVVPVGQVALVTVGEVALRPMVEGRGLVAAPAFTAVVTADHRRYDGVDSAKLLGAFVEDLARLTSEGAK
jgi:pyruvate dehydrogenase E2 component (dihydrolipoamide acetyltransferase)